MENPKSPAFLDEELPGDRARRLGAERLNRAVAELPLRYAPFFARLAALWEMPEEQAQNELRRAKDARAWRSTLLRGLTLFSVKGPEHAGARARLMRLEPGVHFPKHTHRGRESVLVLEGAYADATGVEVHAGDVQTMPEGSEHELVILGNEPCVAAITERGLEFTSPWLRWASKLMR